MNGVTSFAHILGRNVAFSDEVCAQKMREHLRVNAICFDFRIVDYACFARVNERTVHVLVDGDSRRLLTLGPRLVSYVVSGCRNDALELASARIRMDLQALSRNPGIGSLAFLAINAMNFVANCAPFGGALEAVGDILGDRFDVRSRTAHSLSLSLHYWQYNGYKIIRNYVKVPTGFYCSICTLCMRAEQLSTTVEANSRVQN